MGVKYLFWSAKAATEKIERDAILEKRTRALARLEAEERARLEGVRERLELLQRG